MPKSDRLFDKNWQVYRKVFLHNYMRHRELASIINDFLVEYFDRGFSVLDLGCGDANFSALALANTPIAAYQGVDLSATALDLAQENMKDIASDRIFIHSDFLIYLSELLQTKTEKFDIILSSFALHHLHRHRKDDLLSHILSLLNKNGVFLLVDIVLQEEETRAEYLHRYIDRIATHWDSLTPDEFSLIEEHIRTSDFPETQTTFQLLAAKHHLEYRSIYLNPLYTEQVLAFTPTK
jgi:cyclopropane fatty-acyl-phospholipid synthase-like methyltransferase